MNITSETATALGEKLAGLNLTEEEGVLLTTLLAGEDEVNGFGGSKDARGPSRNFEEIKVTFLPRVLGPLPKGWNIEQGSAWNIEQGSAWNIEQGSA